VVHTGDGTGVRPQTDQGLASSRPPAGFAPMRVWELSSVTDLSRVRRELLTEVTAGHDDPGAVLGRVPENMVLVASELATNALEHGLPPTVLTLATDDTSYLLDVCDSDLESVPMLAGERPVGAGGFGLLIARRVSQDVGWYTEDDAKHVWAMFSAGEASS
jgi:hypothetical protein